MAISRPVISSKLPLDDGDDCKLEEFRKPKTVMRKYPPPQIRIGVEAVRDFPPGCGILQDSLVSNADRKPLKKLDIGNGKIVNSQPFEDKKLDSIKHEGLGFKNPSFGTRPSDKVDQPPVCGIMQERKPLKKLDNVDSKLVECHPLKNSKLKSFKPKESGINNHSFGSRPIGKVQYWDPTSSNDDNAQKAKDTNTIVSRNEQIRREKIREAMILFDKVYTHLLQNNGSKQKGEKITHWRVPKEAAKMVKQKLKWMNADKTLGQIRGIQPGDMFKLRSQLQMVGLHCQLLNGIDYTSIDGKNLAISIVDSHRYSNQSQSCDVLTYCGEGGGAGFLGSKPQVAPDDQKLERGNLALKNSMIKKSPVRVIRKLVGVVKKNNEVFVYDGLYTVKHCKHKRGSEGNMVFMFELHRMPGQPQVHKRVNAIPGDVTSHHHSTFQML